MQSVKNKRRFQRFIVTRDVEVYLQTVHSDVNLAGRLVDVSYPFVGLRLACSQEIPPDSRVRLEFVKEEGKQAFVYEGDIAWCVQKMSNETAQVPPHYHVGVSLKETNQKNRQMLEETIADLVPEWVREQYYSVRERAEELGIEYTDEIDQVIAPWIEENYQFSALIDILHDMNSLEPDVLLTELAEAAKKIVHSEASSLILVDDQTQEMTICLPTGPVEGRLTGQKVPPGSQDMLAD